MKFLVLAIATGLGSGYVPRIPGSVGTLLGIRIFYFLQHLPRWSFGLTVVALIFVSIWLSSLAESMLGKKDDPRIVIDEVVGFLVTVLIFPFQWDVVVGAYVLFRFFDILKPPPIRWIQAHCPSGWGIVLDDVAAGLYALIILAIFLHYWRLVS